MKKMIVVGLVLLALLAAAGWRLLPGARQVQVYGGWVNVYVTVGERRVVDGMWCVRALGECVGPELQPTVGGK
jgi:hypothetical protein